MVDPESDVDREAAARMALEPDALHEEDGLSIDCPQCGATVNVPHVVEEGQCGGYVGEDEKEGDGEFPQGGGCGAKLSLELVWSA